MKKCLSNICVKVNSTAKKLVWKTNWGISVLREIIKKNPYFWKTRHKVLWQLSYIKQNFIIHCDTKQPKLWSSFSTKSPLAAEHPCKHTVLRHNLVVKETNTSIIFFYLTREWPIQSEGYQSSFHFISNNNAKGRDWTLDVSVFPAYCDLTLFPLLESFWGHYCAIEKKDFG